MPAPVSNAEQASGVCRFCLEDVCDDASSEQRAVAPCACRGTSALVHIACLRRWQDSILSRRLNAESLARATICSVCKQTLVVDGCALEPVVPEAVRSLRAGNLVVATENLEGEGRTFHRSVILICQVERTGQIRGVDLSRQLDATDGPLKDALRAEQIRAGKLHVRVFNGGPVCGGRLGVVQYTVLGTFQESWRSGIAFAPSPENDSPGLYSPAPWHNLDVGRAAETVRRAASRECSSQSEHLFLFRGHVAWGRGQLEAEMKSGNWATCTAEAHDMFEVQPGDLWARLQASGRLARARPSEGAPDTQTRMGG